MTGFIVRASYSLSLYDGPEIVRDMNNFGRTCFHIPREDGGEEGGEREGGERAYMCVYISPGGVYRDFRVVLREPLRGCYMQNLPRRAV